jgi:hypothetical protein
MTAKKTEVKTETKKPAPKKQSAEKVALPPVGSAAYKAALLRGEIKE